MSKIEQAWQKNRAHSKYIADALYICESQHTCSLHSVLEWNTAFFFQGERFLCERCYQVTAQSTAAKLASVGALPSASAQQTQDKFG